MSLSPTLYQITPFDAKKTFDFTFTFSGFQVFYSEIIIKNNLTNVTVYDNKTENRLLSYTLPINTLVNGTTYNAQLYVYDVNNIQSSISNMINFSCYDIPILSFSNLVSNQTILNSYYDFILTYSQLQNRTLNSYQIKLYNSNQSQIYTTGTKYDVTLLSNTLNSFDNNTNYYIEAIGDTIDGVSISTGLILFSVQYITPSMFSLLKPINLPLLGEVQLTSNLVSIEGISTPSDPQYINNEMVDLSNNGTSVLFNQGFNITDDFILQMNFKSLNPNESILELSNLDDSMIIKLSYMESSFVDSNGLIGYINLRVIGGGLVYTINTEYISPMSLLDYNYNLWMKKINNIYQLKISKI